MNQTFKTWTILGEESFPLRRRATADIVGDGASHGSYEAVEKYMRVMATLRGKIHYGYVPAPRRAGT